MKVFDGKPAVEEYMSTHTLTFSTPEITLKKFVIWLSEIVENNGEKVPRITLYLQTRDRENEKQRQSDETTKPINFSELFQNIDETFKPTEAITDRFNKTESSFSKNSEYSTNSDSKFCIECGNKLTADSKFCTKCGARQ
jgi:hypothetical protein